MKLKDVATIKHGFPYKGEYFTDVPTKNILLTPTNFTLKGGFQYANRYYSNEGEMPEEFNLHKDDLIVTMTDLSKEIDTIGYGALIPDDPNHVFLHNQRIGLVTIFNPIVDKYYLYWLMRTKFYQRTIAGASNGATVHHTSPDRILSFNWIFPSLDNQKKIASILSAYDSQIENNKKRIKLLEQMAENLYKEWFVRFRFPGYETAEFEGGVPKGWKRVSLREYANVIMGQSPESCFYNTEKLGLPFHQGCGSYGEFYLRDDIYSTEGKRIAEPNSIIFSVRAPVGRINLTLNKIILGRGVAGINAKNNNNAFLLWLLKQKFSKEDIIGNGAIFTSVTKNELLGQKLLIPNKELERKFNIIASNIETEIKLLTLQKEVLTTQRDLLLPRLMSGKLSI